MAGYFNIDLSTDKKTLKRLYESVDLSGKLIILEDFEHTDIPLSALMGYINNIAERDSTRVLLVANEEAMLKTEKGTESSQPGIEKSPVYTQATNDYLEIKEKTISDTVRFECNLNQAISQIIKQYDDDDLKQFDSPEAIADIKNIMALKRCCNLRSFLFACQKTSDIFNYLDQSIDFDDFRKTIILQHYKFFYFVEKWKYAKMVRQ